MFNRIVLILIIAVGLGNIFGQNIPAPKDVLGFTPGDDRKLASWNQIVDYFQKLEDTSNRVKFEAIGKTTMDKPFVYATISSPANLKNLEKYKQINAKLADPRLIKSNEAVAKSLIKQGKTIVLITFGIHSTEVGSTLSSTLLAHRLASSNEPEIKKILDDTIILLVPSLNPDGVDIVKNWYDKTLGTPYEGSEPPELYHKYVGHDNNRDWYAFTQVETQLTVDKIHNVWHPQIVQDVHQQGAFGARMFIPPYTQPVEPNVPKQIVEGYTELGTFVADEMRKTGFQGITNNSTYDAWTPARAYSHYHGGVRILTEIASARLATPINVEFDKLRGDHGYDAKIESDNYKPLWKGGDWKLKNITDYMESSSFHLLKHAAANREKWLSRFYSIGKEAVRPRKKGEVFGYLFDGFSGGGEELREIVFDLAKVETVWTNEGVFVKMAQPYGSFAKALLENQEYPNLKDEKENPIPPYDVTAHTLSLLYNVEVEPVYSPYKINLPSGGMSGNDFGACQEINKNIAIYKSYVPSMDEGWTRYLLDKSFEQRCVLSSSLYDKAIKAGNLSVDAFRKDLTILQYSKQVPVKKTYGTIIFPDQSPIAVLNGHPKGTMPDEYTGGIGKEGVANLKKFVEDGGTLVFLNRASDFAIEQFNLPIKDVTLGLNRKDFFIPGSILRTELDVNHKLAKGMEKESIAWFENSPAFEVLSVAPASAGVVEIVAKYPDNPKEILLSGWALGAEKIAGKAALVQVNIGKGKIMLFGFRPQYRGQSLATFPLFFNAIQ
jgi:Zinc carboxypeptidase